MVCICLYIDPCMENSTRVISLWWSRVKYLLIEKLKERDKLQQHSPAAGSPAGNEGLGPHPAWWSLCFEFLGEHCHLSVLMEK